MITDRLHKIQEEYLSKMKLISDNIPKCDFNETDIKKMIDSSFTIMNVQIGLLYPCLKGYECIFGKDTKDIILETVEEIYSKIDEHYKNDAEFKIVRQGDKEDAGK